MHRSHHRRTSKTVAASLLVAVTIVGLAACGDDDGASKEYADFCDAELAVERATSGDDPEAIGTAFAALVEAAPEDDKAIVEHTIELAQEFMEADMPPSDEFNASYGDVVELVSDNCGFGSMEATAAEYKFTGLPDSTDSGPTVVTFHNDGNEFHEMAIMRRNPGTDQTVEELLALPQDEAEALVTQVGGAFAAPGTTGYTVVDLEPGDYIIACFVPTGMTMAAYDEMMSGGGEPDGAPHAMNGMHVDLEVKA
jgi:hypothetical protein